MIPALIHEESEAPMFPGDVLLEWLDLKLPNWFALLSGAFLGILGVLALSFMVALFGPDLLAFWMPLLIFFSASSAGYTFWQKREPQKKSLLLLLAALLGLIVFLAGAAVQITVDHYLFHARTGLPFLAAYACCGPLGGLLGGLLRSRYERQLSHRHQA